MQVDRSIEKLKGVGPPAELLNQLPLKLRLEDYQSTEKIAYLPSKLRSATGRPGMAPSPGDIAYYTPWGNLAMFYRGGPHAIGLVRLGSLLGDASRLREVSTGEVLVARVDP